MNKGFAGSFLSVGIIVLILTAGLFLYKSFTGYEKVAFYKTVEGCTVKLDKHVTRGRNAHTYYYVTVDCPQENMHFHSVVSYSYYNAFRSYRLDRVTFYTNENNMYFPTYMLNCDAKEAEREYRQIYAPLFWYILYSLGLLIGLANVSMGIKARRASNNYEEVRPAPYQFETTEDAIAAMQIARIRREKTNKYAASGLQKRLDERSSDKNKFN